MHPESRKGKNRVGKNKIKYMDDIPICPDFWPLILWQLHFRVIPWHHEGGGNPVNYPPATEAILSALLAHTSSYLLLDQKAGAVIRSEAVKSIVETAQKMDKLHDAENKKK